MKEVEIIKSLSKKEFLEEAKEYLEKQNENQNRPYFG